MVLRLASHRDRDWWLAVRNDPESRAASISTGPISPEAHEHWWGRMTTAQDVRLYVAEMDGARVGYGRLDEFPDGRTAQASVAIHPDYRGRGFATPLIEALVRERRPWTETVVAAIRVGNERSAHAFERAGFVWVGRRHGIDSYQWQVAGEMATCA